MKKHREAFEKHNITTIDFLFNNAHELDEMIIAGTRGWYYDEDAANAPDNADFQKLTNREELRLRTSLKEAAKLKELSPTKEIVVFMHFPPVYNDFICRELIDVLHEYDIKNCFFGHIHGNYYMNRTTEFEGIDFVMVASDYLNFAPMPIFPEN